MRRLTSISSSRAITGSRVPRRGFSLVELMMALVVGMILAGALITFMIASFESNSDFMRATRLAQELRFAMDFVSSELRRAGYDEDALSYAMQGATGAATSDFAPMLFIPDVDGDGVDDDACIIYAYDRSTGDAGRVNLSNGEIRGIRLVRVAVNGTASTGVIEMAESSAGVTPACDDPAADYSAYPPTCTGGWCAVTDSRELDVSAFSLDLGGVINVPGTAFATPMQVRDVHVVLTGNPIGDASATRSMASSIRVRADCTKAASDCALAPVKTGSN